MPRRCNTPLHWSDFVEYRGFNTDLLDHAPYDRVKLIAAVGSSVVASIPVVNA